MLLIELRTTFVSWTRTVSGVIFVCVWINPVLSVVPTKFISMCKKLQASKMAANCSENKDFIFYFLVNLHFVLCTAISDLVCSFLYSYILVRRCNIGKCNKSVQSSCE